MRQSKITVVMCSQLRFRWLCLKHAWRGSWGAANALGAIGGGTILWLLSRQLGLRMDAPTSVQGVLAFGVGVAVVSVILMWLLIFIARCFLAPAQLYAEAETKIQERDLQLVNGSSSRAALDVTLYQKEQYNGTRSHRIGITNGGQVVAQNVKLSLQDIVPRPSTRFRNDFPYRVPKADAHWKIDHTIPIIDAEINPGEQEIFQLFESWLIGDDSGELAMHGLDTKRNGDSYDLRTKPGNVWVLEYEIRSANSPRVNFSITATVSDKNITTAKST